MKPEEFEAAVADPEFRDLLVVFWETGARSHELFTAEASFLDEPGSRWIFPIRKSKDRRIQRVVYLTERAMEVVRRLSLAHRSGPVFRNTDGRPWNFSSVKCRFQNLRVTLGRKKSEELGLAPSQLPWLKAGLRGDQRLRAEHERRVK